MKTRISKIARLPLALRDQLNHRLQNGEMGSSLLTWLNSLPEVLSVLAELFQAQPINKQNLSAWRHGGYADWLRHQSRQQRIQQITEQGDQLGQCESDNDLCACFSKILIAEMAEELETLHQLTDRQERWQLLHQISRDLARLHNHLPSTLDSAKPRPTLPLKAFAKPGRDCNHPCTLFIKTTRKRDAANL